MSKLITAISAVLAGAAMLSATSFAARPPDKGPPDNGEDTQGNNLSFPAILADGYSVTAVAESFTVVYDGDYPGLTAEEIAALGDDDWYPQKTDGNTWQAANEAWTKVDVSYIDWGDNVESNKPKVRRPFRLEVVLFKQLNDWTAWNALNPTNGMTAYRMAVLEYPSSADELQGTNTDTYESNFATVVSGDWGLKIQYCGTEIPEEMSWNGSSWQSNPTCTNVPISFATELNVGGKLIFGASEGGWKPNQTGWYRITFYPKGETAVSLAYAAVGNYDDFSVPPTDPGAVAAESDEGDGAATPVVDAANNISYVDVEVVGGGGGGKPNR